MMKNRDYIKKSESKIVTNMKKSLLLLQKFNDLLSLRQKLLICGILGILAIPVISFFFIHHNTVMISEEGLVQFANSPVAATSMKRGIITVPSGMTKKNPFVPYRDIGDNRRVQDVPAYDLVEPPEMVDGNSEAARVMDTTVSGILYDKYSPSAILNIEGNDYLVKKGDVVNNYKVISIMQDSVTVKLGNNTYKAGIGEILTEGTLRQNDVPNLSKKFGGEK